MVELTKFMVWDVNFQILETKKKLFVISFNFFKFLVK